MIAVTTAAKTCGDLLACGITVAVVASWLPPIAAGITIVWTALRIIEMFTGKTIHELIHKE
jgi:hypothetical protein